MFTSSDADELNDRHATLGKALVFSERSRGRRFPHLPKHREIKKVNAASVYLQEWRELHQRGRKCSGCCDQRSVAAMREARHHADQFTDAANPELGEKLADLRSDCTDRHLALCRNLCGLQSLRQQDSNLCLGSG